MANDQSPIEGEEASALSGALSFAGWKISDIWGEMKEWVSEIKKDPDSFIWWVAKDLWDFADRWDNPWEIFKKWKEAVTTFFDPISFDDFSKPRKSRYNDDDEKRWEKFAALKWWQISSEMLGTLSGASKSKDMQDNFSLKLVWTTYSDFEKNVKKINESMEKIWKQIDDTVWSDPKYAEIREFERVAMDEYLIVKWVSRIEDEKDYEAFVQEKIKSLDPANQALIFAQYNSRSAAISPFNQQLESEKSKLKEYVNSVVKPSEWKTWEQEYKELMDSMKWIQHEWEMYDLQNEVREKSRKRVDAEYEKNAKLIARAWDYDDGLRDEIVDQIATMDEYGITVLWMKDIPNNRELAELFAERAEVKAKFLINVGISYELRKNSKDFAGMSEIEKRKRITEEQWKSLSDDYKQKFRELEWVITWIDILTKQQRLWKNVEEYWVWLKDWRWIDSTRYVLEIAWSRLGRSMDKVFEAAEWVPHYVMQESRSLIYENEWNLKKLWSMFAYNADAIFSVIASSIGTWFWSWIAKWAAWASKGILESIVDTGSKKALEWMWKALVNGSIKWYKVPTYIGLTNWTMRIVWGSIAQSAATDPIFDNLMVQAPSKGIDAFNAITGTLFDVWQFTWAQTLKYGMYRPITSTANGIMWKFMNEDKKAAVTDMMKHLSETKPDIKYTRDQVVKLMEEGEKILRSTVNENEMARMLETPNEMYRYVSENVKKMEDSRLQALINGGWIWIRLPEVAGIKNEVYDDLDSMVSRASEEISKTKSDFAVLKTLEKRLTDFTEWSKWKEVAGLEQLSTAKFRKSDEHKELVFKIESAKKKIYDGVITSDNKSIEAGKRELETAVRWLTDKFSISDRRQKVVIQMFQPGKMRPVEFEVFLNDLDKLEGKSVLETVKDGTIVVRDDQLKNVKWSFVRSWEYRIKWYDRDNYNAVIQNHVFENRKEIEDFFRDELWVDEVNWKLWEVFAKMRDWKGGYAKQFVHSYVNLLNGWVWEFAFVRELVPNTNEADHIEMLKKVWGFTQRLASKLFWDAMWSWDRIINDFPSINEKLIKKPNLMVGWEILDDKLKKTKDEVDQKILIEHFAQEQDWYVNINYWTYKNKKYTETLDNKVYLTFGKEVWSKFEHLYNRVSTDSKHPESQKYVQSYANTVSNKIRLAIQYGTKEDGSIDLIEWLRKVNVVESTKTRSVFEKWVLSQEKVFAEVDSVVEAMKLQDPKWTTKEFVWQALQWFGPDMDDLMLPFINNITYQVASNTETIAAAVKLLWITNKKDELMQAIAAIILDPKMYEQIVDKTVLDISESNKKLYKDTAEKAWYDLVERFEWRMKEYEMRIEDLSKIKKYQKDFIKKQDIEDEIKKLKSSVKQIAKLISEWKEKFIKDKTWKFFKDWMLENIEAMADRSAFNVAFFDKAREKSDAWIVSRLEALKREREADMKLVEISKSKDWEKNIEAIRKYLEDVSAQDTKVWMMQLAENVPFEVWSKEYEVAKHYADAIANRLNSFWIYDEEWFRKWMAEAFADTEQRMTREEADANNPILVRIQSLITDNEFEYDEKLMEAFVKKYSDVVIEYDSLEKMILDSKSIQDDEKQMYLNLLHWMDAKNKKKLESIFKKERKALWIIWKDIVSKDSLKKISSLRELYFTSDTFRKTIESLRISNADIDWWSISRDVKKRRKELENEIKDLIINNTIPIVIDGKDVTKEYVEKAFKWRWVLHKLQSMMTYWRAWESDLVFISNADGEKIVSMMDENFVVKSIKQKEMDNAWVPIRYLEWIKMWDFWDMKVSVWQKELPILSLVKSQFEKMRTRFPNNDEFIFTHWTAVLEILAAIMNWRSLPKYFDLDKDWFGKMVNTIKTQVLPNLKIKWDTDVFIGGIGDKDGTYRIYQSWLKKEFGWEAALVMAETHVMIEWWFFNVPVSLAEKDAKRYEQLIDRTSTKTWYANFEKAFKKHFAWKKPSMEDVLDFRWEYFKYGKGEDESSVILDSRTTRKREGMTGSEYHTFSDVKLPINCYVLEEERPFITLKDWTTKEIDWIYDSYFPKIEEWSDQKVYQSEISRLMRDVEATLDEMRDNSDPNYSWFVGIKKELELIIGRSESEWSVDYESAFRKIKWYLENVYVKDQEDGYSAITEDLWSLRAEINNIDYERQYKDHWIFKTKNWNFAAKTLMNVESVTDENGVPMEMSAFIGSSSVKLKWWVRKTEKWIRINWVLRKVIWEVDWVDTSFFRNASSDAAKEKDEQTISDQIKSKLPSDLQKRFEAVQVWNIDEWIDKMANNLSDPFVPVRARGSINEKLAKLTAKTWVGAWTDSVVKAKLEDALRTIETIVEKPTGKGQSFFAKKVSTLIYPHQVILSKDSELVKMAREIQKKRLDSLDQESQEYAELKSKYDNYKWLYTVGYRYPVPSWYNLGAYEIVTPDKISVPDYEVKDGKRVVKKWKNILPFETLWSKQAVFHPNPAFGKMEADFDADHVMMIPSDSEYGSILTDFVTGSSEWKWRERMEEVSDKYAKWIDPNSHEIINDFLTVEQAVPKPKEKWKPKFDDYATLDVQWLRALNWKSTIAVAAATIRTLDSFRYLLDMWPEYLKSKKWERVVIKKPDDTWRLWDVAITYGDLLKRIEDLNFGPQFFEIASSILQKTVDAGALDEELSKDWVINMLEWAGIKKNRKELSDFYAEIISPLSMWYNSFDITDTSTISSYALYLKKSYAEREEFWRKFNEWELTWDSDWYLKMWPVGMARVFWSKRDSYQYALTNENAWFKLAQAVEELNKSFDAQFLVSTILEKPDSELYDIAKKIQDTFRYTKEVLAEWEAPTVIISRKKRSKLIEIISPKLKEMADQKIEWLNVTFREYVELVDKYYESSKSNSFKSVWEKLEVEKKLFWYSTIEKLSETQQHMAALYAIGKGEYKVFQRLTEADRMKYVKDSDKWKQRKMAKLWIQLNVGSDIEKVIEWLKSELSNVSEKMKLKTSKEEKNVLKSDQIDISEQITELEAKLQELAMQWKAETKPVSESILAEMIEIPETSVFIPDVSYQSVDTSPNAINEISSMYVDVDEKRKAWFAFLWDTVWKRYMPSFYALYNGVWAELKTAEIKLAWMYHVKEFSPYSFLSWKTIHKSIKSIWGYNDEDVEKIWKELQSLLIKKIDWKWQAIPEEEVAWRIISKMWEKHPWIAQLATDETWFMKRVQEYRKTVIEPVAKKLNSLEVLYDKNFKQIYAEWSEHSMITDVIEAYKQNPTLALKMEWLWTKEKFLNALSQWEDAVVHTFAWLTWWKLFDWQKQRLVDIVFPTKWWTLDSILAFLTWVHYEMSYGTIATIFTQWNIIAWFAQMLPNYIEINSYLSRNIKIVREIEPVLRRYWLLDNEDVLAFGTGNWIEMNQSYWIRVVSVATKWLTTAVSEKVPWITKERAVRAGEFVDSFVNNPMWFNDYPLEYYRKIMAVAEAMRVFWFGDDVGKLVDFFETASVRNIDNFKTEVRSKFIESGGWVVTSGIGRWTVFEDMHYAFSNNPWIRFFVKSMTYLMGWAIHKSVKAIEQNSAIWSAIRNIVHWKTSTAVEIMWDVFRYNAMLSKQIAAATAIYLKFQKYEKDDKDRMSAKEFVWNFSNSLVAVEILFWQHYKQWTAAGEFWSASDQFWYTSYGVFNRMFRLFRQPHFVATAYQKYQADSKIWKESLHWAFVFAMEQHYNSYMRLAWMEAAEWAFAHLRWQSNLWILAVWWATLADDLKWDIDSYKSFAKWKDEWTISMLSDIIAYVPKDWTLWYRVVSDMSNELVKRMNTDKELLKLKNGWEIWVGKTNYDVRQLVWSEWSGLTADQENAIREIWDAVEYGWCSEVDKYGRRTKKAGWSMKSESWYYTESKEQLLLEKRIEELAKKNGMDIQQLISASPYDPAVIKMMATLELKTAESVPAFVSALFKIANTRTQNDVKEKEGWLLTWVTYWKTKWITLSTEQELKIKRDIIAKMQWYLNLDATLVGQVIESHVRQNHKDTFEKFRDIDEKMQIRDQVMSVLKTEQIINSNIRIYGDMSSVSKLKSIYASSLRWINVDDETWAKVLIWILNKIQDAPFMAEKEKLGHMAGAIMWMNAKQAGIMRDNKRFNELTEDTQRQLTNWLYKVSSDSVSFDSTSYLAWLNAAAAKNKSTSAPFDWKFKSKPFSWQRPNFSKQFDWVRDMLEGKRDMMEKDPRGYLQAMRWTMQDGYSPNMARMPIVKELAMEILRQTYFGQESKWIIKKEYPEQKKQFAREFKIRKPNKAKSKKQFAPPKIPKKVSRWLIWGMPMANYE